jgi:hypothetical protein
MGNSGGGTQTAYLLSLDDRIAAASPSCYITSFERLIDTIGPQDAEQNIFGQLERGLDHADYLMLRAPTPTLMCVATRDYFDIRGAWDSFRQAKRLYSRLGFPQRIEIVEHDDKHGYNQPLREAAVSWMLRWLGSKDVRVSEPAIDLFTDEELQCTPKGQVMLLPDARSAYDLNRDACTGWREARKHRAGLVKADDIRRVTGIRPADKLPEVKLEEKGQVQRKGYTIDKYVIQAAEGIVLPALFFQPAKPAEKAAVVLYVHEQGKHADADPGGPIERLVLAGSPVLAVDLRGIGETHPKPDTKPNAPFGGDSPDVMLAYLLGKSYVAMRAEDILRARAIAAYLGEDDAPAVKLVAVGNAGIPALHAAALEPERFSSIELHRTLASWEQIIQTPQSTNQLVSAVHGALRAYDLPDLAALLGDKVRLIEPLDGQGKVID